MDGWMDGWMNECMYVCVKDYKTKVLYHFKELYCTVCQTSGDVHRNAVQCINTVCFIHV